MKLIYILLFLTSCGYFDKIKPKESNPNPTKVELLEAEYERRLRAYGSELPSTVDCDLLLWSSIAGVGGVDIDYMAFTDGAGRWFRRPSKDCFDSGDSRSDISNDQLSGLLWLLYVRNDYEEIGKLADYAEANKFVMGRGDEGATILKANLQGILGRLANRSYKNIRVPYLRGTDYVRHIQVLQISLYAEISGGIPADNLRLLRGYDDGKDYAVAAVVAKYDGKTEKVIDLLLNPPKPPGYVRGVNPKKLEEGRWLMWAKYTLDSLD